jgi:hypothetical protein
MADLPRDIGFDDDPVILISYTILGDNGSQDDFKPPNITSPIRKYRDRTKSESSILSGNKKKHSKSSVSSLSDDSCTSYDLVDSEQGRLNEVIQVLIIYLFNKITVFNELDKLPLAIYIYV